MSLVTREGSYEKFMEVILLATQKKKVALSLRIPPVENGEGWLVLLETTL